MVYRSEIDALRAISVSAVVVFHFFPSNFYYGYLGVDIFFVISGYLISLSLLEKKRKLKFISLIKFFYQRRFKRIIPALFFFLFISSLVIVFLYISSDIKRFNDSLIATLTFWANLYFWRDGGYFGGNDQLKPLLHMWSISVEEQFYILYPTLFFFLISLKNKFTPLIVIIFTTIFSFSFWIYLNQLDAGIAAFFLLPSRAWEFGLGSIIAFFHYKKFYFKSFHSNFLKIVSIFLLIIGFYCNFSNVINTIIITLASSFYLYSLPNLNEKIFKFLSIQPFTFLGKISYSIYLYHWLIGASLRYVVITNPNFYLSILAIFLSFFFGWLSYKFIEFPLRYKVSFSKAFLLSISFAFISLLTIYFGIKLEKKTLISDLGKYSGTNFRCKLKSYIVYGASKACLIGYNNNKKDNHINQVALVGNSHIQMYSPLVNDILLKKKISGILIPLNTCLPTVKINVSKDCINKAIINLNKIKSDNKIDLVIIGSTWYDKEYIDYFGNKKNLSNLIEAFNDLINELKKSDKKVILFSPIEIPNVNLASQLPRLLKFGKLEEKDINSKMKKSRSIYDNKFKKINNTFKKSLGSSYVEVYKDLCDNTFCYFGKERTIFFADENHISKHALKLLSNTRNSLEKIIN